MRPIARRDTCHDHGWSLRHRASIGLGAISGPLAHQRATRRHRNRPRCGQALDSSKFTGNFAGCGEARHLPVHGADLGVCKHVNSATSCVGGVADHRRPGAGSVPAGPGRSFHLEATGSEPLCLADVPLVSSTVFPTGQVDCFDESAPRSGTFCRSGPPSPSQCSPPELIDAAGRPIHSFRRQAGD